MRIRARRDHGSGIKGLLTLRSGGVLSWSKSARDARIWETNGNVLHELASDAEINGMLELRDGRLLAWAQDRRLRLWDANGTLLHTTERHHGSITGVLELEDGRLLSWGHDHKPRLWSSMGSPIRHLAAHGGQVWGMLELRDGRLFSWASHTYPRLWNSNGDLLRDLRHWSWPRTFFFRLRDGRCIYWLNVDELHVLSADEGDVPLYPGEEYSPLTCGAIELCDGRLLSWAADFNTTTYHGDGKVTHQHAHDYSMRVWSPSGRLLNRLEGHTGCIQGAIELKNGRILSWSQDGELRLWGMYGGLRLWPLDGRLRRKIGRHSAQVAGTLQVSDGRLISWSHDGTIRVWTEEGKPAAAFQGEAPILHCAALRDGQTVAAGDEQGHLMFLQLP